MQILLHVRLSLVNRNSSGCCV